MRPGAEKIARHTGDLTYWGAGTRTRIAGSKGRSLAIRRPPIASPAKRILRPGAAPSAALRGYDADVTAPVVVILAAGQGTRMRSATPKLLHPLCGRPLLEWPIAAARAAGAAKVVVVGGPDRALEPHLPPEPDVVLAVQAEPRGTADAVLAAAAEIDRDAPVIVLCGDVPLLTAEALRELAAAHAEHGAAATMLTMVLDDPTGYGRVVRGPDGAVEKVVETKKAGDATALELEIREVNGGVYAFAGGDLLDALGHAGFEPELHFEGEVASVVCARAV